MGEMNRRAVYYLALAGMELSLWGLVHALWAAAVGPVAVSLGDIAGLLLLSLLVNLALLQAGLGSNAARWSTAVGIACAWFFAAHNSHGDSGLPFAFWSTLQDLLAIGFGDFRAGLFAFLVGLILWWRGARLIRIPRDHRHVSFHFRAGVLVLLFLLMLRATTPAANPRSYIVFYFAASLIALALARAEETRMIPGGTPLTLGWKWTVWLFAATAGTLALGLVAAWAVSFASLHTFLGWMSPVLDPIAQGIYEALLWFARILDPIMRALVLLFQQAYEGRPPQPVAPPSLAGQGPLPAPVQWPPWLLTVLTTLRWLAVVAVALLALWLLVQALAQRKQATADNAVRGQAEPLSRDRKPANGKGLGEFMKRAGDAAGRAFRRWRRPQTPAEQVKWLYAQLLRLGAERGFPRPPGATPYDYETTLRKQFEGCDHEIQAMTQAYVRAHYAESQIDEMTLEGVRQAWKKMGEGNPARFSVGR